MLTDMTVTDFVEKLKSNSPTPGGGGVAALNSALGAALIMMVANHTIGQSKYAEWEGDCVRICKECDALRAELLAGVDADAVAFGRVAAAFGMPKSTAEEKASRTQEIGEASIEAAEAPLAVMKASTAALELCSAMLGKSNPNLESDLYVAALNLRAGIQSARYNVEANLPAIRKRQPELAEDMEARCTEYSEKGNNLTQKILTFK